MQSQAYPSGEQGAGGEDDHKKKSVIGKVKDKAKKLGTKMKKPSKKSKDEHGNDVEGGTSSSSSEDEGGDLPSQGQEKMGYEEPAATPEPRHEGAVHGGGGDYQSREVDLNPEKKESGGLLSGGEHGHADPSAPAPGSEWPSKDSEPRSATSEAPSWDETNKRQEEVPAAPGHESYGISSGIASSGLGSEPKEKTDVGSRGVDSSSLAAGDLAGKTEEKIPEGVMKPTSESQDEEAKPVVDGVDSSGRDLLSSEVVDESPTDKVDASENKELNKSDSQKGWMQRASESVASVKNVFMGSPKASTADSTTAPTGVEGTPQDSKTWTEKAKDTVASKLPSSTGPTDVPVSGQKAGEGESATGTAPTVTSRAMDSATAVKDTVASKLGYSETGTQTTETAPASGIDSTDQASQPGITQKVMGMKDVVASKLGYGTPGAGAPGAEGETGAKAAGEGKNSKLFTPDDEDTALSQKITDMLTLGGSKNTGTPQATSETPASPDSTNPQGKGVMDRVTGVMGSFLGKKQPDEKTASDPNVATKDTTMSDATA